jgi:4-diphosphocytidyl-2-C-methyl-D-erythritol kinase
MSSPLRVCSFAKINLALAVLGKRPDGFHEIRTVFQSIDLHDEIEFQESRDLQLECENLPDLPVDRNLAWKAAEALLRKTGLSRGVRILLKKSIPPGAGLGGGSSNAAATLLGLCRFWNVEVAKPDLISLAADLGSDVAFFLEGGTALGIGRGEEVYPLPPVASTPLVVIYPGVHVSTAEAYRSLNLRLTSREATHKIQGFCGRLSGDTSFPAGIFNDFETSILPAYPEILEAKNFLIRRGAAAAMLSGSGSSVFGFFLDEESALAAARVTCPEGWRVLPAKTLSRAEYSRRLFG